MPTTTLPWPDLAPAHAFPPGFVHRPGFLAPDEERQLLARVEALEFHEARMRGQVARRRLAHFGYRYELARGRLEPGPTLPGFLVALRARAAAEAGVDPEALEQSLVARYPAGAGIGWHRDAEAFGPTVVGLSLGSPATMRLRPYGAGGRAVLALVLEPGSLYVISGEARSAWEHAVSPVRALRYAITFRSLRGGGGGA